MLPGCSRENPFPSIQIWILCYSSFLAVTQAQHTDLYLQKKKKKQKTFAGETHPKSHAVMLCHLWSCRKRCNQVRQVSCEVFASLLPAMIKWSIKPGERTPSPPSINAKMWLISRFEAHLAADVNDSRLAGAFGVIPAFHLGWKWAGWWVWRRKHRPSPLAPIYKITYKSTQSVPSVMSSSTALSYRNNRKSTKTEPGSCLFSTWSRLSVCWL